MKTLGCLALIATLLALAGCDEAGENVVWSPDGRQAAVIGTKGLYLCDAGGKLSPLLVPRATHARWLPDGKRLVVARSMDFATWREVAPQLSDAERNYVVTTAKRLLDNWLAAAPEELEIAPAGRPADHARSSRPEHVRAGRIGPGGGKESAGTSAPIVEGPGERSVRAADRAGL
jgi:hypothetical protein